MKKSNAVLPVPPESNVEYEAAVSVSREQERRRIGTYVHENLAQEVVSMVFSIESIRLDLESKDPAAAAPGITFGKTRRPGEGRG